MKRASLLRRYLAAAACVVSMGMISACGGSSGEAESELNVGVPVTILSIDPHGSAIGERTTLMAVEHIFDPLVRMEDGELQPALAESWENTDPTRWEFALRQGVTFHDGTELTSEDVKASLERMFSTETSLSPLWATIESVEAPDEYTVVINTSVPDGSLLTNLSLAHIASADQIESGEIESPQPVGTGPFEVEEFSPGERTVLTANADYWDGAPDYERLMLREIPELASRLTALETGEIEITYSLPPDQMDQIKNFDDVVIDTVPSLNNYFVWFNNERKPFDDQRVRQAMWHAIDWKSIQAELFGDEAATTALAPVPQAAFGAAELSPYEYDPERARALLAEAGYPDGFKTSIQWSSECCINIRSVTQTVISDLAEVGVNVEPLEKERGIWLEDLLALNFDMNIQTNGIITGDAGYALDRLYTCNAERLGYCSEEYDKAMAAAGKALDSDKREELLKAAQKILWEDAAAMFPMDLTANAAWRSNISGFEPAPNNVPDFRSVSISK